MEVSIAFGNLCIEPPGSLLKYLDSDTKNKLAHANGERRRRELEWSRGLASQLDALHSGSSVGRASKLSISHDRNFTAVGLIAGGDLGVDIQSSRSLESGNRIADAWFPLQESIEIRNSQKKLRFLQSWVLKEAWAKSLRTSIFTTCGTVSLWGGRVQLPKHETIIGTFLWSIIGKTSDGYLVFPCGDNDYETDCQQITVAVVGVCCLGHQQCEEEVSTFILGENESLEQVDLNWNALHFGGVRRK